MKSAKEIAKQLITTANTVKLFNGIGSVTLSGTLKEFKKEVDDFDEFLKIIDGEGYCLKNRADTHLGIFPADDDENFVLIEK